MSFPSLLHRPLGRAACALALAAFGALLLAASAARADTILATSFAEPLQLTVTPLAGTQQAGLAELGRSISLDAQVCMLGTFCYAQQRYWSDQGPFPLTQQFDMGPARLDGGILDAALASTLSAALEPPGTAPAWFGFAHQRSLASIDLEVGPYSVLTVSRQVGAALELDTPSRPDSQAAAAWWLRLDSGAGQSALDYFELRATGERDAHGAKVLNVGFSNAAPDPVRVNLSLFGYVQSTLPAVPEPGGIALWCAGLLLLALPGARRRRAAWLAAAGAALAPALAAAQTIDVSAAFAALTADVRPLDGGTGARSVVPWLRVEQVAQSCRVGAICEYARLEGRADAAPPFAVEAVSDGAAAAATLAGSEGGGTMTVHIDQRGAAKRADTFAYALAVGRLHLAPRSVAQLSTPASISVQPLLPAGADYRALAALWLGQDTLAFDSVAGAAAELSALLLYEVANTSFDWLTVDVELYGSVEAIALPLVPEAAAWQMLGCGMLLLVSVQARRARLARTRRTLK
jgi:hypothetical protein